MDITEQKWYAVPADSHSDEEPRNVDWQVLSESGKLVVTGDREFVEHIVGMQNLRLAAQDFKREVKYGVKHEEIHTDGP